MASKKSKYYVICNMKYSKVNKRSGKIQYYYGEQRIPVPKEVEDQIDACKTKNKKEWVLEETEVRIVGKWW